MSTALPSIFLERLSTIVPPANLATVINSFSTTKPVAFRVNTLKYDIDAVTTELAQANFQLTSIPWYDCAFTIPHAQREQLVQTDIFNDGKIYIQSVSSMLPPLILAPQPGEEILDLTAAPGSKTTQIASLMQNQGRLAAVEKSKPRFFKLQRILEQQGATCVKTYLKDGRQVWRSCQDRFDRILLDAPCSSEGRFSTHDPTSFQYWSEQKIKAMSRKQWQLLHSAFLSLKPGGILVYSTCTFAPEENECIIDKLIKKYNSTLTIEPIQCPVPDHQPGLTEWQTKPLAKAVNHSIRILPNKHIDGFFICKIKKLIV